MIELNLEQGQAVARSEWNKNVGQPLLMFFPPPAVRPGGREHRRAGDPDVVPAYGLGTDDGGQPYDAKRLIFSGSLNQEIDRFRKGRGPV